MFASLIEECRSAVLDEMLAKSLKKKARKPEAQVHHSRGDSSARDTLHSDGDRDDDGESDEDEHKKARTAFSKDQNMRKQAKASKKHRTQQRFSAQKRTATMKTALSKISSAVKSKAKP
jgi:hypothetical protein